MKKISIFALVVIMLVTGTLSAFPVAAATSMVDSLVVHYDFEGKSAGEALKDKALKDSVSDDLVCYVGKSADGTNFATNGDYEATPAEIGSDAFASAIRWDHVNGHVTAGNSVSLQAKTSNETKTLLSAQSTVVMHFYTGQVPADQNSFLVSMASSTANVSIIFELGYQTDGKVFLRARTPKSDGGVNFTKLCYPLIDKWYTVAITITEDAANGKITFGGAMNLNGESKWTAIDNTVTTYAKNSSMYDVAPLSLFGLPGGAGNNYASISDFRIYNRALNTDEIEMLGFTKLPAPSADIPPLGGDSTDDTPSDGNNGDEGNDPGTTPNDPNTNDPNNNQNQGNTNKPNTSGGSSSSSKPSTSKDDDTQKVTDKTQETTTLTEAPEQNEAESGCGASTLGIATLAIVLVSCLAITVTKKKRSE